MEGYYQRGNGNIIDSAGFTLAPQMQERVTEGNRVLVINYFHDDLMTDYAGRLSLTLDKHGRLAGIERTYIGPDGVVSWLGEIERGKGTVRVFEEVSIDNDPEGKVEVKSVLNIFRSKVNGLLAIGLIVEDDVLEVIGALHYDTDNKVTLIPSLNRESCVAIAADVVPTDLNLESIYLPGGDTTLGATTPNGSMYTFGTMSNGILLKSSQYLKGKVGFD